MPSFRLDGRRALVAGASRGIGLGCATALAEAGAHVICAARSKEDLQSVVDAINEAGFSAEALRLDITDLDATRSAIAALGALDIFVNSAAEVVPGAQVLVLVKPQFEVGRGQVGKGGVVRDPAARAQAVLEIRQCAESLGYVVAGEAESVLAGPKGNREVFLWLRSP